MLPYKFVVKVLTILIFAFTSEVHAQDYFSGTIVDAITQEPLPYVNIGVFDKGIGTVSNVAGKFTLKLSIEKQWSESIQFSSIGYETRSMAIKDLVFNVDEFPKIGLKQKIEVLDGIVLSGEGALKPYPESVGFSTSNMVNFGYWNEDMALGAELATEIPVKKGLRNLRELSFTVIEKAADSVLVRVNVYKGDVSLPKENLAKDNILMLVKSIGVIRVDLRPYDINVSDDFIVSLELVKVYGEKVDLVLLASNTHGNSYKRYASQDKWERIEGPAMAYVLDTDYYTVPKGKYKKRTERIDKPVSGYVFKRGRALPNIEIVNETTKERVRTNSKGIYTIEAQRNDILRIFISENEEHLKTVDEHRIINLSF